MSRLAVCFLSLFIFGGALCQLILPWQACEMQCLKENNATYPYHATPEISEHCHTYCQNHWQDMFNTLGK